MDVVSRNCSIVYCLTGRGDVPAPLLAGATWEAASAADKRLAAMNRIDASLRRAHDSAETKRQVGQARQVGGIGLLGLVGRVGRVRSGDWRWSGGLCRTSEALG